MTTLDSFSLAQQDRAEVYRAALAMADFDGKFRDYRDALEWLDAAEAVGPLTPEYLYKRRCWQRRTRVDPMQVAVLGGAHPLPL